jgi:hypothetical protein
MQAASILLIPSAIDRKFSAPPQRYPGSPYAVNNDKFELFMNDLGSQRGSKRSRKAA